ncbi:MAG TPA: hypothetical protein VIG49_07615, partial [Acetobacteraceae bacterium]
ELRLADPYLPAFGTRWTLQVSPFLFVDYGVVHARDKATALDGTLTSVGPGVRVGLGRQADLVVDMGEQIRFAGRSYPGQFFDVSVTVRY